MTPERWQQVKQIFQSALERNRAERSAFVAQACGHDAVLRSEVESLISSHDQAGNSIEAAAAEAATEMLADDQAGRIVGKQIGHYQVLSRIGRGGMGEVFLAHDTSLGRKVALKLLRGDVTKDEDRLRRFRQEARSASALNHPNILTIHEIGQEDSLHFIATEYVEGETLRDHMTGAHMTVGEVLDVAVQVASALAVAHQAGIIHRDIKPENLMLRTDGFLKVLDFGLAKLTESTAGSDSLAPTRQKLETQPGVVMGTANYMSPEQARGLEVDARTDIWSLGCVLYEMLAGRQPFAGPTMLDVLSAILNREPDMLEHQMPDVPRELERIVSKTMRKDASARYQTVSDLLIDLKQLKRDLEVQAELQRIPSASMVRDQRALSIGAGVATLGGERRLIVLPFRMLRPDEETEFLAFSLPDAISSSLAGLNSLVIRSSLSASRFANADPDLRVIATEAAVNTVLTGTLLRAGDQVRLSAQLVEAPSGTLIWSHTAQVDLGDIFQVHDDLVNRIVDSLSVPLTSREREMVERDVPANAIAYELYLRANEAAQDVRQISDARVLYERSVELDPQYAPTWARLGRCYWWQAKWSSHADQDLELADQAFQRAFRLNPDLPLAHNLYARFEADRGRAILALQRLLHRVKISRLDAELYVGLVQACRYAGLLRASIAAHSRAVSLDPQAGSSVAYTYFMICDYSQVMSAPKADIGYIEACTLMLMNHIPEASEVISKSLPVVKGTSYAGGLEILADIIEGNRTKSLESIERRLQRKFVDLEHCYHLSRQMSYLREMRRALDTLSLITERGFCCYPALTIDPWFEPLRGNEEFQTVVAQAKALHDKARRAFIEAGGEQTLSIAAG